MTQFLHKKTNPLLKIEELHKSFDTNKVLKGINFEVSRKEVIREGLNNCRYSSTLT